MVQVNCPVCNRRVAKRPLSGRYVKHNLPRPVNSKYGFTYPAPYSPCPAGDKTDEEISAMVSKREVLETALNSAAERLATHDRAHAKYGAKLDGLHDGAVVRFRKRYAKNGPNYWYAALYVQGWWHLTGQGIATNSLVPTRFRRVSQDTFIDWLAGDPPMSAGYPAHKFEVLHRGGKHRTVDIPPAGKHSAANDPGLMSADGDPGGYGDPQNPEEVQPT
jgi:hypothetical protein